MQIIYQDSHHLLTIKQTNYFYNNQPCTSDEAVQILQFILESRDSAHVEKFDTLESGLDILSISEIVNH